MMPAEFLTNRLHPLGSVYADRSYICSVIAWSVLGTMLCKGFKNVVSPKTFMGWANVLS